MKVLIVEDEIKLGGAIKRGLEQDGYAVDLVHDADDGLSYAETEDYDVIVLDRMLPDGRDGLDICRDLRQSANVTPVLMLTARGEVTDRVGGLDSGADDYLVKPFDFDELLARLRALVRRPATVVGPQLTVQDITIDTAAKTVVRNGTLIPLSRREYALFEYLVHHKGSIVSKDQLIQHVWDFDADILPNTVEVFIRTLRQKIGDTKKNSVIETVRGFGYRVRDSR
jgi:DNA-binding response OmpR family regulator